MAMGPWSYVFVISVSAIFIGVIVQWKLNQIPELPSRIDHEYDYIIVGGGTSGCVLANRLSEDPNVRVLVLEAGQDDRDHPTVRVPIKAMESAHSNIDWGFQTVAQEHALKSFDSQKAWWYSGKILGGSSNTNDMLYVRGFKQDYDRWAGDSSEWRFNHILPYFLKSENNENADFVKTGYHRMGGPLRVGRSKTHSLTNYLVRAGKEMGFSITDINGDNPEGIVEFQSTVYKGKRQSATRAFLYPALSRPNLHVKVNSLVTKVVIKNKQAVGVTFQHNNTMSTVKAKREIILCAGTVASAKLLLLSGVGPKKHLESLKIPVHADLPVGENLQDPMTFDFPIGIKRPISITRDKLQSPWENIKYTLVGKGMMASPNGVEMATYTSSAANKMKSWPDLQLLFRGILADMEQAKIWGFTNQTLEEISQRSQYFHEGLSCQPTVLRPSSKGTLRLSSDKPDSDPLIDPGYLQHKTDVEVLLDGIKICQKVIETPSMKKIGASYAEQPGSVSCPTYKFGSDDFWRCMIRARAQPSAKPVGTCRMGTAGDKSAVTDENLRVKGISKLRVIDASVMPHPPSGGYYIPTIMIAEKGADLIKGI